MQTGQRLPNMVTTFVKPFIFAFLLTEPEKKATKHLGFLSNPNPNKQSINVDFLPHS